MTQRTPYLRPDDAPKTSTSAAWALGLGIASFVCMAGPPLALVAIVLGFVGLSEIKSTQGRMEGRGYAIAGIALGGFNVAAIGVAILVFFISALTHKPSTSGTPVAAPPFGAPTPGPGGTATPPSSDEGKTTRSYEVREVKVGTVTLVDIPPTKKSLEAELELQREKAAKAKETLILFTVGDSLSAEHAPCRPCTSVTAILGDARMQAALGRARLIRVDTYELRAEIEDLGAWTQWTPGFFLLGPDLAAKDGIDGGEWDDDTPDNVAPVLSAFVKGKLPFEKRRQPTKRVGPRKPSKRAPKPSTTML